MEFDYTVTTTKKFNATSRRVQAEIVRAGLRVLHVHDVQKTLGEKGFVREPFHIIEFCNAQLADDFLKADIKIGLCMPCKINVYVTDGHTYISGLRPIVLAQFFPQADLGAGPAAIDTLIVTIINNAK